jgi:hypothetical protein
MHWVVLHRRDDVEAGLFKPQGQAAGSREKVYGQRAADLSEQLAATVSVSIRVLRTVHPDLLRIVVP